MNALSFRIDEYGPLAPENLQLPLQCLKRQLGFAGISCVRACQ